MTLVFSPTNAMRDLNESPQRKATLALANHTLPPLKNLFDPYPDDLRFGMCECGLGDDCFYTYNANNQHPDLRMTDGDFIALTQQEAYNVFKERGITHIIYTGFATNICVWDKPTGAKYMRQFGFRCMLARDLTEAMTGYAEESFNPTQGTLEVIALIERELAPSISMEQTLRRAGAWTGQPLLDFVHLAPWGRLFGGPAVPVPIEVELTCRHVPGANCVTTLTATIQPRRLLFTEKRSQSVKPRCSRRRDSRRGSWPRLSARQSTGNSRQCRILPTCSSPTWSPHTR